MDQSKVDTEQDAWESSYGRHTSKGALKINFSSLNTLSQVSLGQILLLRKDIGKKEDVRK